MEGGEGFGGFESQAGVSDQLLHVNLSSGRYEVVLTILREWGENIEHRTPNIE